MQAKTPKQSRATLTEIVLPNDTNNLNNLMGGRLLHWMDIAAAITAHRHCNRTCVTASVNNVSFEHPIPRGSIVTLEDIDKGEKLTNENDKLRNVKWKAGR